MWNKLKVVMLGIVLTVTIIPSNSQITRLFPVIEEISTRILEIPVVDTFLSEPYSPKVVYPLPPGVTTSSTIKTPLATDGEILPSKLSLSMNVDLSNETPIASELTPLETEEKLNIPTKSSTPIEMINFIQENTQVVEFPSSTTEGLALTQKINHHDKESQLSTNDTPGKTKNSTSTVTSPTQIATVPESIAKPKECTTPIGKNGECKDIRRCPSLISLLTREPLLMENKLYLQRSQCGLVNQTVLACCPDSVPPAIVSPKLSLLPKSKMCGSMNTNRLYGGYTTEIDSFSWMALLEYAKGENETGFHCGGALINDRYVLTAAHCVSSLPESWSIKSVRLGEWDLATNMDCSNFGDQLDCSDPPINISIEEVIPHKDYLPTSNNRINDIALIRLSTQVISTDFIQPICLPVGEHKLHAFDEQSLDLVGWGASPEGLWNNVKQKTDAQVIKLNNCRSKYAEYNITLEPSQFCVEGRLRNDTCRIDSGGSLISFDTANKGLGRHYIAGIQSFSQFPCWNEVLPAVYTRVADYLDWILENIRA